MPARGALRSCPVHEPSTPTVEAAIALGSNRSRHGLDPGAILRAAIAAIHRLPRTGPGPISSLIRTAPVGPVDQPEFVNGAMLITTSLPARELLASLLAIEQSFGRERGREQRWGPRTLDLDLLLYGEDVIDEPGLRVPHPRMHERAFVLVPLAEIAPDRIVPGTGRTVRQLRESLGHPA